MDIITNLFKKNLFIAKKTKYYNWYTKCLYTINDANSSIFRIYYYRFMLCSLGAIVFISLEYTKPLYVILTSLVLYIYLTWYFYRHILPRFSFTPKFSISALRYEDKIKQHQNKPNYMQSTLFITFGILLIINTLIAQYQMYISLLCYGISVCVIYSGIKQLLRK